MRILKYFLLALLGGTLSAGVEDHLKPALNKNALGQVKNIDFIYTINLDQRPEKFTKCKEQLAFYGIEPYRFSAVNGWELSLETINDVGVIYQPWMSMEKWGTYYPDFEPHHEVVHEVGRNYFCHCMSRGAIGIVLSHLSILQDAYDSGFNTIWIMEDDIDVVRDPHSLSELIEKLDNLVGDWDILFTDPDTKNDSGAYVPSFGYAWRPNYRPADPERFLRRSEISPDFKKIGSRFGAYSMIVRRSGMKKILDFFKNFQIFLPYDIEYVLPYDMRLYSLVYDVVSTQPRAQSDNGAPNYLKK